MVFGGDLNGHAEKGSDGYEGVNRRHGVGHRNTDGKRFLEFGRCSRDDCF